MEEMMAGMPEPDLEIEIEDPEEVTIRAGGMEIEIDPDNEQNDEFNTNLAEELSDKVLEMLSGDLLGDYEGDVSARRDWLDTYVDGLELLGLKLEDRSEPWEGACNVYHPLMTEALVKFQAETMMETFPAAGPVKTQIIGKGNKRKRRSVSRVSKRT
jgi:hypothetical protein